MDLKYIWIKSHKILHNFELNFNHNGNHKFNYDGRRLAITQNKESILDFGDKISGITAIAGQNGSGKSSLCEIILASTATLKEGGFGVNIAFNGIVCFADHIFCQEDNLLENQDELQKAGYELVFFKESPFESMLTKWYDTFTKNGFIYYSHFVDQRSAYEEFNLVNISTEYLLVEEYKYSTAYNRHIPDNSFLNRNLNVFRDSEMNIYYLGQAYRNLNFYLQFTDFIPFAAFKYFVLKSSCHQNNRWLSLNRFEDYQIRRPYDEFERRILDILYYTYSSTEDEELDSPIEQRKLAILALYKLNIIRAIANNIGFLPNPQRASLFIFEDGRIDDMYEYDFQIGRLVDAYEKIIENMEMSELKFNPRRMATNNSNDIDWRFGLIESQFLLNTPNNRILLKEFMLLEEVALNLNSSTFRRITNYSYFPYLSSGENAFLSFFSRFYDVLNRYKGGYDQIKNVVLFLDEPDLGFHPEWSRKFFHWLLEFINNHIKGYTFQIIITTHSPYLLSDLDDQHVILLSKDNEGYSEIVQTTSRSTFAANIHDLLAKSFFLQQGTIGEFAKKTIQTIIESLNESRSRKGLEWQSDAEELNKRRLLELINIIADPVIRNKLFEMYYEIFGDQDVLDNEIRLLEKRLENLKNRKR